MRIPTLDHPWTIAHRGDSADCPENTLPAFERALAAGADGIELDLQLTRDGVPVVYHDRTLARAGGGGRRVADLALDELAALDAGAWFGPPFAGQRIPTLAQVLDLCGGRTRLLLEIKARESGRAAQERHRMLVAELARLVAERELSASVMVLCFAPAVLEACRTTAPELPRVLNLRPLPVLRAGLRRTLADLWALSVDVSRLTQSFASAVRRAGCPLLVYTCNTERQLVRALRAGARGVMSDRPVWLRERLREARGDAA